jgi:alkanesulfonate monooxygenase SsuD/methylene tetrahydromethanopterin reductase-like flavin-dependent oxidoreductase (luciferase family)
MRTPQQLSDGIQRLASYARRFGRDPAEIEVIYGARQFDLKRNGESSGSERLPFVGSAEQVASDIRHYEEMGVGTLIFDFIRQSEEVDEILAKMEEFASRVWPKV